VNNPLLQWELVTVEIYVSVLAITNGVLEDFPSLVLNVVSLVMAFSHPDFEPSAQFYASFCALIVSCITGGRKTYLRDKLRWLRMRKGEIEQQTKMMSGGRKGSVIGGSLKMIRPQDVEGGEGEVRGTEGVRGAKGSKVVPVTGGAGIKGAEGARREEFKMLTTRLQTSRGLK